MEEFPLLQEIHDHFEGQDFATIMMNLDKVSLEEANDFLRNNNYTFTEFGWDVYNNPDPLLRWPVHNAYNDYVINSETLPQTIFIDADRNVRYGKSYKLNVAYFYINLIEELV